MPGFNPMSESLILSHFTNKQVRKNVADAAVKIDNKLPSGFDNSFVNWDVEISITIVQA